MHQNDNLTLSNVCNNCFSSDYRCFILVKSACIVMTFIVAVTDFIMLTFTLIAIHVIVIASIYITINLFCHVIN